MIGRSWTIVIEIMLRVTLIYRYLLVLPLLLDLLLFWKQLRHIFSNFHVISKWFKMLCLQLLRVINCTSRARENWNWTAGWIEFVLNPNRGFVYYKVDRCVHFLPCERRWRIMELNRRTLMEKAFEISLIMEREYYAASQFCEKNQDRMC